MLIELLVAAAVTAGGPAVPPMPASERRARELLRTAPPPATPRLPEVPRSGKLPNGGRACLILDRCDPRPCIVPARPGPPTKRCDPERRPRPRVIPAATS